MALPGGLGFHWAASECRGTGWAGTTSGERDEPGRKNFSSQNDTGQRLGETSASNRCPACKRTTRPRQRLSAAGVKRVDYGLMLPQPLLLGPSSTVLMPLSVQFSIAASENFWSAN